MVASCSGLPEQAGVCLAQGQLLSPLPLAFQACDYMLRALPGAKEPGGGLL